MLFFFASLAVCILPIYFVACWYFSIFNILLLSIKKKEKKKKRPKGFTC